MALDGNLEIRLNEFSKQDANQATLWEAAETFSLLAIAASSTQLWPTVRGVVVKRSVGHLPLLPHMLEAAWRTW